MSKQILDFSIFINSNLSFPIIKIAEEDIEIKPTLRNNLQVEELIKKAYRNSKITNTILNQGLLDKDSNENMLTIGLYKNNELVITLSGKLINLEELKQYYDDAPEPILNFLKIMEKYAKNLKIIEATRFAARESNINNRIFAKYYKLFFAYFLILIKYYYLNEDYIIFSNCKNKHNKFYQKLFNKNERISTSKSTVFRNVENNLNLFIKKENSENLKAYTWKILNKLKKFEKKAA